MNEEIMLLNEREVNQMLRGIWKRMLLVIPVIIVAYIAGIFDISRGRMILAVGGASVILLIPLITYKYCGESVQKWIYILNYTIVATILFSITYTNTIFIMLLPIIIASLYYSMRMIRISIVFVVAGLLIGEISGCALQLGYSAEKEYIMMHMILYVLQIISIGLFLIQLAKRTYRMLEKSHNLTAELQEYVINNKETSREVNGSIDIVHNNLESAQVQIESVESSIDSIVESSRGIVMDAKESQKIVLESQNGMKNVLNQSEILTKISLQLEQDANESKSYLEEFKNSVTEIREKSQNSRQSMYELSQRMDEVRESIALIETISAQTELLALNASIEAARCGESGKGFSVIANEVKQLAGQTAATNQKIKDMIHDAMEMTTQVSDSIMDNYHKVENSRSYIDSAQDSFDRFIQTQKTINQEIDGIAHTMIRYMKQSELLNEQMDRLLHKNELNAEEIEEIRIAVNAISEQSMRIRENIEEIQKQASSLVEE